MQMKILADNWTAAGSIAAGFGALAAFLAIVATIGVYLSQNRRDRATAVRQNLQYLHGQQTLVTRSIESGFLAMIERQVRDFRERLGSTAESSYFLDQIFGNSRPPGDRSLFEASALDSNMSSTMYSRMSDIWDGMNMKALELRGALGVFSYACQVLTGEARRLCTPKTTIDILDAMAARGDREDLSKINNLDDLVNKLLSDQIELAKSQFADEEYRIGQGCYFIGMLSDVILRLPDKGILKLARKNVQQPDLDELAKRPYEAINKSLTYLQSALP